MQLHLLKYSDNCFISLTSYLDEVRAHSSVESIHRLRLAIKKLNALFEILRYWEEIPILKDEVKIVDQIYKESGFLRDCQVQIGLLKGYRNRVGAGVDIIVRKLTNENRQYQESIKRKISRINHFDLVLLNQRIDNSIEMLSDYFIEIILSDKATDLFNQINQTIGNNPDEKALHRIRKVLKELIYTLMIIKKGKGKPMPHALALTYLTGLQQALGDWHDLKVLLERVNCFKTEFAELIDVIASDKETKRLAVFHELMKIEWLSLYK